MACAKPHGRAADLVDDVDLLLVFKSNGDLIHTYRDLSLPLQFPVLASTFLANRDKAE